MEYSKLEKLWEGTQQLRNLKTIVMCGSSDLKEIPNLSKAINLERVDFSRCKNLESFPSPLNSESLDYLNLTGCSLLRNFPQIKMGSSRYEIEIKVEDCLWNKNLPGHDYLDCLRRCYPIKFLPQHLVHLEVKGTTLEKLWEGVQSLGSLLRMDLSESENLKEIPDLSKATNLDYLNLSFCNNLVRFPSTIRNLQKLETLEMRFCTRLEVLPDDVDLSSLTTLNLNGCSNLTSFPQISTSIEELYLDDTAIEEVPCCIEMFQRLVELSMRRCNKLKNISPKIFRLANLKMVNFVDCECIITMVATINDPCETIEKGNKVEKTRSNDHCYFIFGNCLKLDRDARELIIPSSLKWTVVLPGGELPAYFMLRAYGNSLTVTLPQSSLSHHFWRFNVCLVVEPVASTFPSLYLHFGFNGVFYKHALVGVPQIWKNHLVLFSFKFQPTSILDNNDLEFKFEGCTRVKEIGIRLLNMSPSSDDSDGKSSKIDVVETERINKQMQMTSSEQIFNLPCDQIVTDTRLIAPNDSMITEQQDEQLPIARYDVFPSFSGEDVRKGFLSHLLMAFERKDINTFIDNGIGPTGLELISALEKQGSQ